MFTVSFVMASKSFSSDKIQPVADKFLSALKAERDVAAAFAADKTAPAPQNAEFPGELTTEQLIKATQATSNVLLARAAAQSLVNGGTGVVHHGRTRSTRWAYIPSNDPSTGETAESESDAAPVAAA